MKKGIFVLAVIIIFFPLSCEKQRSEEAVETDHAANEETIAPVAEIVRNSLLTAIDKLKEGDAEGGTALIEDAIKLIKPEEETTGAIQEEKLPASEEKEAEGEIAPIAETVKNKILSAIEAFEKGQVDDGANQLREVLKLIHLK